MTWLLLVCISFRIGFGRYDIYIYIFTVHTFFFWFLDWIVEFLDRFCILIWIWESFFCLGVCLGCQVFGFGFGASVFQDLFCMGAFWFSCGSGSVCGLAWLVLL